MQGPPGHSASAGAVDQVSPLEENCAVASWAQFETEAPQLAAVAARLWPGMVALHRGAAKPVDVPWFPVSYLATVRGDGSPRLHPICPILAGGLLFVAIPRTSPNGLDLRWDSRCAFTVLPGAIDVEL